MYWFDLTEEEQVDNEGKKDHAERSEDKHHDKVGRPTSERVLLQHAAVPVSEDHVEEKVEPKGAEEQERGDQPPELVVSCDQQRVVVELEGWDDLELDGQGRQHTGRSVGPRNWRHLQVRHSQHLTEAGHLEVFQL